MTLAKAQSHGALGEQYERIRQAWLMFGVPVRLKPHFAYRGESIQLTLPESLFLKGPKSCVSVVVLASRNNIFTLQIGSATPKISQKPWPTLSSVGLSEVRRCGKSARLLQDLRIEMKSPRGVLQVLAIQSTKTPPLASEVLPERVAGPRNATPNIGPKPLLETLKQRLDKKLKHLRAKGAEELEQVVLKAAKNGELNHLLYLNAGCHELLALPPEQLLYNADIDADLTHLETGRIVASDKAIASTAQLRVCNGRPGRFLLRLTGAQSAQELPLLVARYPLPSGIPLEWGPISRSRMAFALGATPALPVGSLPKLSFLGVAGATHAVTDVIVGHCYALAVAVMQGSADYLNLQAKNAGRYFSSRLQSPAPGSSLTFCATEKLVTLEVFVEGQSINWLLSLWDLDAQFSMSQP